MFENINIKKRPIGLTLIEVLIATLILSGGFLAFARLHILSIRHTQSAYLYSLAEAQLLKMSECLQLSKSGYGCAREKSAWQKEIAERLPEGLGKVVKQGRSAQVIVAWNMQWLGDKLGNSCPSGVPVRLTCLVMDVAI
jgi:hypothetical protein